MKYSIKVNGVSNAESSIKGFATIVFGDSFKITNVAILERNDGGLFVSMPRYKTNEKDENGATVYKDVCNPITKEFREELYGNILEAYEALNAPNKAASTDKNEKVELPEFEVKVYPFEREESNLKGLARVVFDNSFVINNVSLIQGKENVFVAMPSYKTKQVDENNKAVYQDVCYPITKEFREKLYGEIVEGYKQAMVEKQAVKQEKFTKRTEKAR